VSRPSNDKAGAAGAPAKAAAPAARAPGVNAGSVAAAPAASAAVPAAAAAAVAAAAPAITAAVAAVSNAAVATATAANAAAAAPGPGASTAVSTPASTAGAATAPARKKSGWGYGRFLRARIGTERLTLELYSGRRKPQPLARLAREYVAAGEAGTPSLPTELAEAFVALEPALAALEASVLADGGKGLRGVTCDVIIDDAWMLYDVVRADLRGLSPRAADALIGASLADVAGVAASELISRWQPQGDSAYTLACGLPANAMPTLRETLRARRIELGSVEGEFVAEYNRHRDNLEPKCSVIAVVREAGAQLAVLINGVLTSMSFEFGVAAPKELELRGRGLLRVAGVGGDGAVRFYAITPAGWKAPDPWVCLPASA